MAAAFVCLLAATISFTGGLFALHYRSYYVQWHAPALTIAWAIQFVHTVATAFYQYMQRPSAREVFVRYGFVMPGEGEK